jgi:hypothetical protein
MICEIRAVVHNNVIYENEEGKWKEKRWAFITPLYMKIKISLQVGTKSRGFA